MYRLIDISMWAYYRKRQHECRRCSQRPKSQLDVLQQSWNVGHIHHHRHYRSLHAAESSIPVSCSCLDADQCPSQCGRYITFIVVKPVLLVPQVISHCVKRWGLVCGVLSPSDWRVLTTIIMSCGGAVEPLPEMLLVCITAVKEHLITAFYTVSGFTQTSVVKGRWLCYFLESRSTCLKIYFLSKN